MAQKITNKTTDLQIGTVLKAIQIEEHAPFELGKFYKITNGDCVGAYEINEEIAYQYTINELGDYFEHIATIDDIEDFESKALLIKQIFNQFKELSEDAEEKISHESLINEAIAFLVKDEVYQCDEIELQFICDDMDISMVEECSCCGMFISPEHDCYGDELNDGAALCDHCSEYNEGSDMYRKFVQKDVIEQLTGFKFSPQLEDVNLKIEEFNCWLNKHEHKFGFNEPKNKVIFYEYIKEYTVWDICDCCQMIEKSDDLALTDGQFFDDEKVAINFVNASYSNFAAICQNCLNKFISRTKLSLHEIVQRIKENKMIFRIGDFVILKNKDLISNNMFAYIESLDETTQTYKLKGLENVVIKEEDLFDVANEAYIVEYNMFIKNNHTEKVDDLSDFANDNKEHTIDMLVENFGLKDEFIEHLKANDLSYERFLNKDSEVVVDDDLAEALNTHKEEIRKSKKYALRTYAEYGAPLEVILELQELFNIYANGVKNPELELLLLQDSRNTQDFSSIEILVQDEIKCDDNSSYLKSTLDKEHHDEVDNLLKAIKEAKADKHEVLHVYDC